MILASVVKLPETFVKYKIELATENLTKEIKMKKKQMVKKKKKCEKSSFSNKVLSGN